MKKWKVMIAAVGMLLALTGNRMAVHAEDHVTALQAAAKEDSGINIKRYGQPENPDYSFRLKRTEKTTCTWMDTSGVQGKSPYHQKGKKKERWGQIITSDRQKGKISCFLTNMGSYKGKTANVKITFTDWPDYRTTDGKQFFPVVGVMLSLTSDLYGLTFSDIWYEAKMEVFDDKGNPLHVDMTYRAEDLDYGQMLGIRKKDPISGIHIPEDSRAYYQSDNLFHYFYADNIDSEEYDKDSVQIQYQDTSEFTLRVGGGTALPGSFRYQRYVSEKLKQAYERFSVFMVGEGTVEEADQGNAELGWIAGSAKGYGKFLTPTPQKSTSRTEIHGSEPYDYQIHFKVPECQPADYYQYLKVTDLLPEALLCDHVTVLDKDNEKDVSEAFSIQIGKGKEEKITVSAKNPGSGWLYGKTFSVKITVHKRPEYVFFSSNKIRNTASVETETGIKESNPVENRFFYQILTEVQNGKISPSDLKVPAGSERTIHYTPEEGYKMDAVLADGKEIDSSVYREQYTFSGINADHKIKVIYEKDPVITIAKEVKGSYGYYGKPTFLFRIYGQDKAGRSHCYYRSITFENQFGEEETVRKSIQIKIPAGTWRVREVPVSRYRFAGIKEVKSGKIFGEEVELYTEEEKQAQATFCNELSNFRNWSHNDVVINWFGKGDDK